MTDVPPPAPPVTPDQQNKQFVDNAITILQRSATTDQERKQRAVDFHQAVALAQGNTYERLQLLVQEIRSRNLRLSAVERKVVLDLAQTLRGALAEDVHKTRVDVLRGELDALAAEVGPQATTGWRAYMGALPGIGGLVAGTVQPAAFAAALPGRVTGFFTNFFSSRGSNPITGFRNVMGSFVDRLMLRNL